MAIFQCDHSKIINYIYYFINKGYAPKFAQSGY